MLGQTVNQGRCWSGFLCIEAGEKTTVSFTLIPEDFVCYDVNMKLVVEPGIFKAASTRRATKHSRIHAVVVQWSRTRKRYERQGILAEPKAIQRVMQDCLTDAEIRKIRRQREQQKREEMDLKYIEEFASKIRKLFPRCPAQEEVEIAQHACRKYSGIT